MNQETKQEVLYTVISNLLKQVDISLHKQIQEVGNIEYVVRNHLTELPEDEKKRLDASLDTIQNQFQVFREWVMMANKLLTLVGLPELELTWVIPLDEIKENE